MRHHPDALMLFAAGLGTRMGALTATRPKPLLPVAGKPLIDHALSLADGFPLRTKVINLHYRPDQIKAHLCHRTDLLWSEEAPVLLETGGGLRHALPLLGKGPVFTLNSDTVWRGPNPLQCLSDAWDPAKMDGLLLLLPLDRATGHTGPGDFTRDRSGRIGRNGPHVYLGTQIIRTDGLAAFPEPVFSLNRLWDRMIAAGRAYGVTYPGQWCDVGTATGIALAEALLRDV